MKNLIVAVFMLLTAVSCGDNQMIQGNDCDTYGFFDSPSVGCSKYVHRIVPGNLMWSIVFGSSVIPPMIIMGWGMYEPLPQSEQPPYALAK